MTLLGWCVALQVQVGQAAALDRSARPRTAGATRHSSLEPWTSCPLDLLPCALPSHQVVSPLQSSVTSLEAQVLGVPAEVRGQVAAAQADLGKGVTELRSKVGRGAARDTGRGPEPRGDACLSGRQ